MELVQLLNLQVSPKTANIMSGQKMQTLDGQKLNFLDALSRILSLAPPVSGDSLANKIKLKLSEPNLLESLNLTGEKVENEEEAASSIAAGLESIVIPPLNLEAEKPKQIKQTEQVQTEQVQTQQVQTEQVQTQQVQTELIKNSPQTMCENNKPVAAANPNENLFQVEYAKDPIVAESNLENKVSNQEPVQQISSDLKDLGDLSQDEIVSSEKNKEIFVQTRNLAINILASEKTAPNDDLQNQSSCSLDDEVQTVAQSDNKGTENMEEQTKNSSFSEHTMPEIKKDFKETSSDKFNQSFLTKESNSHYAVTGSQPFSRLAEDDGISQILKEPEVSPKELPEFLLKQINNNLKFNKLTGASELSLRLKPEELGKMTLQLLAQDGQVSVKIMTENSRAREIVEQNLGQLKQTLANQGIKCTSINVSVSTDSSFNQFMGHQHNPFNQAKYSNKGKYSLGTNGRKELQIQELSYAQGSNSSAKRILDGLELFA